MKLFLSTRMARKYRFEKAPARFPIINLFKLPFQVFYWKNITTSTLEVDFYLIPALALGFWAGVVWVGKIRDEQYRKLVIVLTLIGSVMMLLK